MLTGTCQVSVVVPTYNRCQYLSYTLQSLVHQDIDRSAFEVIIVDDGSYDDTFQITRTFEEAINLKYVYQSDRGYRVASARNLGIRVAAGKLCMFIDSGVIVKRDCVSMHLDCHNKRGHEVAVIGYTYGYTLYGDSGEELLGLVDVQDADGSIAKLAEIGRFCDIRENIYRKYADGIEDLTVPWTLFFGGHLSIRKQSLFEVGLFDENYDGNWGCEDNDLGYRLHAAGKKIVLCRDAAALHLPHDTTEKEQQGHENCKYFNQKFGTPETQLFLDYYVKDLSGQASEGCTIDFHELITNAAPAVRHRGADEPTRLSQLSKDNSVDSVGGMCNRDSASEPPIGERNTFSRAQPTGNPENYGLSFL